jgi:hypothetical protein
MPTREGWARTQIIFSCNRLSGEASDIVSALLLLTRIVAEYWREFRPSHLTPMPPEVVLARF